MQNLTTTHDQAKPRRDAVTTVHGPDLRSAVAGITGKNPSEDRIHIDLGAEGVTLRQAVSRPWADGAVAAAVGPIRPFEKAAARGRMLIHGTDVLTWLETYGGTAGDGITAIRISIDAEAKDGPVMTFENRARNGRLSVQRARTTTGDRTDDDESDIAAGAKPGVNAEPRVEIDTAELAWVLSRCLEGTKTATPMSRAETVRIELEPSEDETKPGTLAVTAVSNYAYSIARISCTGCTGLEKRKTLHVPVGAAEAFSRLTADHDLGTSVTTLTAESPADHPGTGPGELTATAHKKGDPADVGVTWTSRTIDTRTGKIDAMLAELAETDAWKITTDIEELHRLLTCSAGITGNDGIAETRQTIVIDVGAGTITGNGGAVSMKTRKATGPDGPKDGSAVPPKLTFNTRLLTQVVCAHARVGQLPAGPVHLILTPDMGLITLRSGDGWTGTGLRAMRA